MKAPAPLWSQDYGRGFEVFAERVAMLLRIGGRESFLGLRPIPFA
jgi:hypothetical protein